MNPLPTSLIYASGINIAMVVPGCVAVLALILSSSRGSNRSDHQRRRAISCGGGGGGGVSVERCAEVVVGDTASTTYDVNTKDVESL